MCRHSPEEKIVHTGDGEEVALVGHTSAGDRREGAAPLVLGAPKEVRGDVDAVEKAEGSEGTRSSEPVSLTVATPEAAVASVHDKVTSGAGLATSKPGSRGTKGGGKNQEQESSARRGQKLLEEKKVGAGDKKVASTSQKAGAEADESSKGEEVAATKIERRAARKTGEEGDEEAGIGEGGGWDSEQAGSLPGLQEGERCCKSNNRSWRCSRTRHPGSRYCIYHIR